MKQLSLVHLDFIQHRLSLSFPVNFPCGLSQLMPCHLQWIIGRHHRPPVVVSIHPVLCCNLHLLPAVPDAYCPYFFPVFFGCIRFCLAILIYRCRNNTAPAYLNGHWAADSDTLRPQAVGPGARLKTVSDCIFDAAAARM